MIPAKKRRTGNRNPVGENVFIAKKDSGLSKDSVALVHQIIYYGR